MQEHDDEPIRGLPGHLPAGERILWQGSPDWRALARSVFWVRAVIGWFLFLALWRGLSQYGLVPIAEAAAYGLAILPVALAGVAVLVLLARATSRSTIYTITNRRVVMRFGIALPLTINVPFNRIESADLRVNKGGSGDIPLRIKGEDKFSYVMLWPHLKPWRIAAPEPMLRGIPEAASVAAVLAEACTNFHGGQAKQSMPAAATVATPETPRDTAHADWKVAI